MGRPIHATYERITVKGTEFVEAKLTPTAERHGLGTLDELFEALTLIQTGKIEDFPVVLVGREYWSGLMNWLVKTVLEEGKISPDDLSLATITDDLDEVVRVIVDRHQTRLHAPDDRLGQGLIRGR